VQFCVLCSSFSEFLRRFCIIVFEDAILHPQLPFLVWLTIVCSRREAEYKPTVRHVSSMLQMVHEVAGVSMKDALMHGEGAPAAMPPNDEEEKPEENEENDSLSHSPSAVASTSSLSSSVPAPTLASPLLDLSPQQRLLVKCILLRTCQGGSSWDLRMLKSYAHLWTKRFITENQHQARQALSSSVSPLSPASASLLSPASSSWITLLHELYSPARCVVPANLRLSTPISVLTVGYVQEDDLVLSAVDQHCSPIVRRNSSARTKVECESKLILSHIVVFVLLVTHPG
jgi:hypothetical protein